MFRPYRRRLGLIAIIAMAATLLPAAAALSTHEHRFGRTATDVEFLGEVTIPSGTMFADTEIGGLSSITYGGNGVYYALSDDQGNRVDGNGDPLEDPVRYYTLRINLEDGSLDDGDIRFVDVTQLYDSKKTPFAPGGVDPEGFALARQGQFYMSSEGNTLASPIIDPFIRRYNRNGRVTAELPIPDHYISNGVDQGVRFNLAFESLNLTPDGRTLVTAGEGALFQDGPASSSTNGSYARMLTYDASKRVPTAEYVYEVGPWAEPSGIFGVNGIVEVLPIDNHGTMLVMERSFSVGGVLGGGTGNVVVINEISTKGATDVLDVDSLDGAIFTPVTKREVFAFDDLGIPIDNIEGMTFGPRLRDGRQTVVIASDNNFSPGQFTQFIVLALSTKRTQ